MKLEKQGTDLGTSGFTQISLLSVSTISYTALYKVGQTVSDKKEVWMVIQFFALRRKTGYILTCVFIIQFSSSPIAFYFFIFNLLVN